MAAKFRVEDEKMNSADPKIERISFSTRINKALIKELKKIALDKDKDLYVVLEEAIENHIQKKSKKHDFWKVAGSISLNVNVNNSNDRPPRIWKA